MTTPPNGLTFTSLEDAASDHFRALIHGEQGSGKSTLASTIAEVGPTLFIDLVGERGTRSFQGAAYSSNIKVVRPTSITQLDDLYWWLAAGGHGFVAVVLDSLSAAQKMAMRFLLGHDETAVREIRQGVAPADMRTWGQVLDIMTDLSTFWFGLADAGRPEPMHVIFTSQTKGIEDDDGETKMYPDVSRGSRAISLAAPDYVMFTEVEDDLDAMTDDGPGRRHVVRFGAHAGYATKARLPASLRGKVPSVLGRKEPLSLARLGKVLGVGGV